MALPVNVLFVCLGNTCRSPVAALLAKELWGDAVLTASAGVDLNAGGKPAPQFGKDSIAALPATIPADAKARIVAALENHTSRQFANADMAPDVYVALHDDVRDALVSTYHIPKEQIVVLGVDDPWRSTPQRELYVQSTREIYDALIAKRGEIFATATRA